MATNIKTIKSLILSLLREVHLGAATEPSQLFKFIIGFGDSGSVLRSGRAFQWWYTAKGASVAWQLANLIRDFHNGQIAIDATSCSEAIQNAPQDNLLNRTLLENVVEKENQKLSLFNAYSPTDPANIASIIWNEIVRFVKLMTSDWLFVYPMQRMRFSSHTFAYDGIVLLAADDKTSWRECQCRFPELFELDTRNGSLYGGTLPLARGPGANWLAVECSGTPLHAFNICRRRAATFLGLLFSVFEKHAPRTAFAQSDAETDNYAAIFSSRSDGPRIQVRSSGTLLHPILGSLDVSSEMISEVEQWYERRRGAETDAQNRSAIAARFINDAAVSDGYKRFLAFFISLDALFGERDKVKQRIVEGVLRHFPSDPWLQKCKRLFDLRSELVHGGTASVEEWHALQKYIEHFHSDPERDIEILTSGCLLAFHQ